MNSLRSIVNKYPLTSFIIAAYALSWWSIPVPIAAGGIMPHGPFLAAVIILVLTKGKLGVKDLFRRMTSWRGGWVWLLIAPGLVVVYLLLAFALNSILGARISSTAHLSYLGTSFLMLLLLGGFWEEPGWTGFVLPLLQDRYANRPNGVLLASLHTGVIRAIWHLPLMITGAIPWYDVVFFSIAFQFLISWLFNRTGGSVLIVMLFHLTSNVIGGGIMAPLFTGVDHDRYYQLFIAMAWFLAILITSIKSWRTDRIGDIP